MIDGMLFNGVLVFFCFCISMGYGGDFSYDRMGGGRVGGRMLILCFKECLVGMLIQLFDCRVRLY